MTGGQTASTTPVGSRTVTDPAGNVFRPFDVCRLVMAAGARYAARFPVTRPLELVDAIEKAIRIKGFTFVEAISPCPTQYGRRNALGDLAEFYDAIDASCVTAEEAARLDEEERRRRFVVGEFVS
jgi:2-oxoglutarate ferredoxin oxidoreductase subunit beta